MHLIVRVRRSVWKLRNRKCFGAVERALTAGRRRFGFHLIHFVKAHRIHLIVEAEHRLALFRGMQGLGVRVARGINRSMGRHGAVLADRYIMRPLRTIGELRAARNFVLVDFSRWPRSSSSLPPLDPDRTQLGPLVYLKIVDDPGRAALTSAFTERPMGNCVMISRSAGSLALNGRR